MLETAKLNSSPDVSRQNAWDRQTKECVTLRQVSWYRRGTFSVDNQTEATCQPERVWMWNQWNWSKNTECKKKKSLGRPPKGLASYVTQHKCDSSFIWTHKLWMPSLPANSLQRQQSANHRLHKKNSRLLSEIPTGNAKHRPQLTYLFTPDYAGTLHTMQYGATSSGPCHGQQQRRAVSAVWVHLQLTATDGNSGFSIISHSKR